MQNHYTLYFDGACGPKNPGGTAAYGFTLYQCGTEIARGNAVIGTGPEMSNNVAEYAALYEGLCEFSKRFGGNLSYLTVRGDSALVINQMSGKWKANGGLYFRNYEAAKNLVANLRKRDARITFEWIPREQNTECDWLSKEWQVSWKDPNDGSTWRAGTV